MNDQICPCNTERRYGECCRPFHLGLVAPDAEALMRSRYSAYVLRLADYILRTWHPSTRLDGLDYLQKLPHPEWLGLDVRRHVRIDPNHAQVEFVVHYRAAGRQHHMHEISRFVREAGQWYYVDGVFPETGA